MIVVVLPGWSRFTTEKPFCSATRVPVLSKKLTTIDAFEISVCPVLRYSTNQKRRPFLVVPSICAPSSALVGIGGAVGGGGGKRCSTGSYDSTGFPIKKKLVRPPSIINANM